ncbi:hydroxymethylglutaryl-CoA reductase, degradative [Sporolactobacillus sp. THM19-2]|uniref:hydroxymethylglutaryl-CoA reductase, degradative n=1 Tax=Sporolactobacillus sp. THM19-2 TaxID=2511171 RepID=UPI0010204090|nr:hydroxymethylglutaryl-CoA reductase, degradative [Sporolactobacillus sp. THM19-2]RYL92400.1 hydroxymethylglutaryl-CoA reductase, degradative [Sporolactobacillus sp. THM19-2]
MEKSFLKKLYLKDRVERINALVSARILPEKDAERLKKGSLLPQETADHMIENQIAAYELPLGVARPFLIDGQDYVVPMAVEEPSVIAAASSAAKIISLAGGFQTDIQNRTMIGQIALLDVPDMAEAEKILYVHKEEILKQANESHPSIVKRGGGAKDLIVRMIKADETANTPPFLVIHLHIETLEAMGANIIDTMVEAVKPVVEDLTKGRALMGIISNYTTKCLATAVCRIPVSLLERGIYSGAEVRDRIIEACKFAIADPYRAVTHNKGIMNGIDPVVMASGNDWRAIEAGVHAYAARSGQYRSLSNWTMADNGDLIGNLTIPLPVGTVGGSIAVHPGAQLAKRILGYQNAKELESIIVSVGLAQNFSALKALVTEGIQKGHMRLHARSLAMSAGAKGEEIRAVADKLKQRKNMDLAAAKAILEEIRSGLL